jgi:hypothetical protein
MSTPFYKKWWVWLIAIIVVISVANSGGGSDTAKFEVGNRYHVLAIWRNHDVFIYDNDNGSV